MTGAAENTLTAIKLARSALFVPADRPERFAKAASSGADAIVLDLEDGVSPAAKDAARNAVLTDLSEARPGMVILRVSHISTEAGLLDLLGLRHAANLPTAIMLPKVESSTEIGIVQSHLARSGQTLPVIALIESARGLAQADEISAHPAVAALALGGADLAADLNAAFAWEPLLFARGRIVQAAAAARLAAWDVPFLDLNDPGGLTRETLASKALGYSGKLAIHPAQIAPINAAFSPDADQVARAHRIIAAFEAASGGVVVVDGRMVDLPVVQAARRVLALASLTRTPPKDAEG